MFQGNNPNNNKNNHNHVKMGKLVAAKGKVGGGAKVPIMKGQLLERDQIEMLVERFTQTYNYKSYAEMDRQYNCHQIEDSIKASSATVLEQVRRQQRQYKEKALAQREQLLAELRLFRASISKLIREDIPSLVHHYKQQHQAMAPTPKPSATQPTNSMQAPVQTSQASSKTSPVPSFTGGHSPQPKGN